MLFSPSQGSTEYPIPQMKGITVNIPRKGYVYNQEKDDDGNVKGWEKRGVFRRSPKNEYTYWEVPPKPVDYQKKVKKELLRQRAEPDYIDPELQRYREEEWDRRLNGYWFYNNGEATYITGLHYFYLAHWRIDIGLPGYREMDKEFFYALQYCVEDPDCMGLVEVTARRQGKTYRGGAFVYEMISRMRKSHGGIQSKTLEDAKDTVFKKAVVLPWKRLESFFQPTYDTGTGSLPKGELSFFPESKKGAKALDDSHDALESTIDYRSGDPVSYDGTKLKAYFCDEAGKSKDIDVYERHSVMEFCFMVGSKYVGKALYSTTVEDMESGGASFKLLWDDSNQLERDENNRTKSGLYRYFLPATKVGVEGDDRTPIDRYGFPVIDKITRFHLNRREELLKTNKKRYLSYVRKQPFTEEEAFYMDSEICLFDALAINKQLDRITSIGEDELCYRGNLLWEDDKKDGRVIFAKRSNGKFLISKRIDPWNGPWNNVQHGLSKYPTNKDLFVIGCDPYDHRRVANPSRRSDGAGYGFAKYSSVEEVSEEFVFEYIDRPDTPEQFHEDMLMACHFFGCMILIENQRPGMINHFYNRGYQRFLMWTKNTEGINANKKTHNELVEGVEVYLAESIEKVVFKNLLVDWLHLDIEDTTKFDAGMAGGWTIVAAGRKKIMMQPEGNLEKVSLSKVFPKNF